MCGSGASLIEKMRDCGADFKPLLPQCEISIVIPVKNEAAHLAAALSAVARQVDLRGQPLDPRRFEIIVLANNCADDSAAIARRWSAPDWFPPVHVAEIEFPAETAHVGAARRAAMDAAFLRFAGQNRAGVIATTDGDTRVAPDWIAANLREVRRGADAVGGRILIDERELDAEVRRRHLQDEEYRLLAAELEGFLDALAHDPNPRHHQHFGASFAVTTEIYRRAGGLPARPFLEDLAFYQKLLRMDARFRHSPNARVTTSARRCGRVAVGLSWQLSEWTRCAAENESSKVESADELAWRFAAAGSLRKIWRAARGGEQIQIEIIAALSQDLRVEPENLSEQIAAAPTCGELLAQILPAPNETDARFPKVETAAAIRGLRQKLSILREQNFNAAQKHRAGTSPRAAR